MRDDEDYDGERAAELAQDEADFIAEEDKRRLERSTPAETSSPDVDLYDVVVDHPVKPALNGSVSGWQVVSARRRQERQAVANAFMGHEIPVWPHYFVTLIRVGANRMDDDGCAASLKSFRDQVAAFLGLDDADPRIVWSYAQKIERVPDLRRPGKFRSYCRVLIGRTAELVAAEIGDVAVALAGEGRTVVGGSKGARRRKPASPEIVGGDDVRSIELPKREDTRTTRVVATLRRLTRPSGRGNSSPAGLVYISLSVFFEAKGEPYRTQGVAVRLNEVEAVIAALVELRALAAV